MKRNLSFLKLLYVILSVTRKNIVIVFIASLSVGCHKDFKELEFSAEKSEGASNLITTQPNIILIIGDDIGYEIPTYSGGESYSTPNLDFMAAKGMQFSNFFCHPDGPPSRLALMTGKYNFRNWVRFGYLAPDAKTIANMLHDAGYATCYIGKWQLDGGDESIKSHGFDKYLVFMPFKPEDNNGHDQFYRRYKDPYLYANGRYLADDVVKGKYSEDMFYNFARRFIDSNKTKPFFLIYSHNLVQKPWSPTPDNPDYATWDPAIDDEARHDPKYFPDMVAYMDKIIGELINKVQTSNLSNRTIIIFTSDNATSQHIRSRYKGQIIRGGKDSTTRRGLSVPLVVYGPGTVLSRVIDTSLADMTDFLPTFAEIAKISKPTTWGTLDGTTFYDNLIGNPVRQRSWVYCYWPTYNIFKHPSISFVYDYNYKLYDSINGGNFYNIRKDLYEQNPIPNGKLTPDEKEKRETFNKILNAALSQ